MVWAAERWGRYSIMFFIHPTSLRHLHIMYMRSLPRNQNFPKCRKCNFILFFIVFTLEISYYICPHLLQVERYKWAIYQRCMRARWRRWRWKFHQLLKLIKVSDRSETFFQFIIITIIIIIIISVSEEDEFLLNRRPKPAGKANDRVLGPGFSLGGYFLGFSQRFALRLQRSGRIGYC